MSIPTNERDYRLALRFEADRLGKCTCGAKLAHLADALGVEAPMAAGIAPKVAATFIQAHCAHTMGLALAKRSDWLKK